MEEGRRTVKRALTFAISRAVSRVAPPTFSQKLLAFESVSMVGVREYRDVHINPALPLQDLQRIRGLVVERDVGAEGLYNLTFSSDPAEAMTLHP